VDGNHTTSSLTSREFVNLVDESPASHNNGSRLTARSGHGQSQHGQQRYSDSFGVPEFRKVEESFRTPHQRAPRKSSGSTDSPWGRGTGDDMLRKQKAARKSESLDPSRRENLDDPIEDDDDQECREVSHVPKKNSTLQVQIPATYQGTANLREPRLKQRGNGRALARAPATTGKKSSYFAQKNGNPHQSRQTRNSEPSDVDEQSQNGFVSGKTGLPKPISSNQAIHPPTTYEDEPSLDELAVGQHRNPHEAARKVLAARKKSTSVRPDAPAEKGAKKIEVVDDSDDEISVRRTNIQPTKFSSQTGAKIVGSRNTQSTNANASRKVKPPATVGQDNYRVRQIFSASKKWLLEPAEHVWFLVHVHSERRLMIHDEVGRFEFDIFAISIHFIEIAPDCSKLILHKTQDLAPGTTGHIIYLELDDADQANSLHERFRELESAIDFHKKQKSFLDKCFLNNRNKRAEPKAQKPLQVDEAEDLKFLREKKAKLQPVFDRAQESKRGAKPGSAAKSDSSDDASKRRKADGVAKRMQTTEKRVEATEIPDDDDDDAQPPKSKTLGMSPGTFYGSGEAARPTTEPSHGTRSSARKRVVSPPKPRSPSPVPGWTILNPYWEERWHSSVVFAGDGKSRATIEKTDIPKLDEGEFLNDSLIYFYLLYLQKHLADAQPDLAKRIYVQNSFFYERLTKQVKGKSRINYEGVRKWTDRANVDIFAKDYIIMPVNENLHWYVAIICNTPKLLNHEIEIEDLPSQESNEKSEDHEVEEVAPAAATLTSSPPPRVASDVDARIAELSLDDASKEERSGKPKPDNPDPSSITEQSSKGADAVSDAEGSDKRKLQNSDDDDDVAPVMSDLLPAPLPAPAKAGRKSKRLSMARKYNPKEPRIITLDSFGHSHSPACTNLKEYLIAELKEKHNKEIPPPGSIGMTAKGIPLQDNYCDCGVFLLGYMERFFKDPDGFVGGILQGGEQNGEKTWVNAPKLRNSIRDLLFKLQKEQAPEPGKKKERKKTNLGSNPNTKPESAASSKPTSREASKSARASVSPDNEKSDTLQNVAAETLAGELAKGTRKSIPPEESRHGRTTSFLPEPSTHVAAKNAKPRVTPEIRNQPKEPEIPESDAEDPEASARASPSPPELSTSADVHVVEEGAHEYPAQQAQSRDSPSLFGTVGKLWNTLMSKTGATESNPVEIEDSQASSAHEAKQIVQKGVARKSPTPAPEYEHPGAAEEEDIGSHSRDRQITPDPGDYDGTPSSVSSNSLDEMGEIPEMPDSPGLDEPFANGSSSHTVTEALIPGNEQNNDHDDEMLLIPSTRRSLKSSSPPSSSHSSSRRENISKKRHHSEAPGKRKRMRVEEDGENRSSGYHETKRDLQDSSEIVAQKIGKRYPPNDGTKVSSSRPSNFGGTHKIFD
jgi:sentrin-specific protease 7